MKTEFDAFMKAVTAEVNEQCRKGIESFSSLMKTPAEPEKPKQEVSEINYRLRECRDQISLFNKLFEECRGAECHTVDKDVLATVLADARTFSLYMDYLTEYMKHFR